MKQAIKEKLKQIWCILTNKKKKRVQLSDPYGVQIENKSSSSRIVTLFGNDDFVNEKNFGNHEQVEIKNLFMYQENGYEILVRQSAVKNFIIGKLRLQGKDIIKLNSKIEFRNDDANGNYYGFRKVASAYADKYQFQNEIVDMDVDIEINGGSKLYVEVMAESKMTVLMFPKAVEVTFYEPRFIQILKYKQTAGEIMLRGWNNFKSFFSKFKNKNK